MNDATATLPTPLASLRSAELARRAYEYAAALDAASKHGARRLAQPSVREAAARLERAALAFAAAR